MKSVKDRIGLNGMLKCLMKTVLVLGLITFSGQVSDFRPYNSEPTRTELIEARKVSSRIEFSFRKVSAKVGFSFLSQIENLAASLFYQENSVAVKFKSNSENRPSIGQCKDFLLYHAAVKSKEFDAHQLRG